MSQAGDAWEIHHVNLPAHDVRESAAFYSAVFGMRETPFQRPAPGGAGAGNFRSDPGALAAFEQVPPGLPGSEARGPNPPGSEARGPNLSGSEARGPNLSGSPGEAGARGPNQPGSPGGLGARGPNLSGSPGGLGARGPNNGLHLVKPVPCFAKDNGLFHNPTIGGHVAISVPDLEVVKRRLEAAGILYSDAGQYAMLGYRQIYLYDPSMNLIEINQRVA